VTDTPDTPETRDSKLLDYFTRHIVGVATRVEVIEDGRSEYHVFSGFVMVVSERALLVMAGHVMSDLERLKNNSSRRLAECALYDSWSMNPVPAIPFNYFDSPHVFIHDDNLGIDCGAISLAPLIVRNLRQAGIRFFDEQTWKDPPSEMDGYFVVGLPEQFNERIESDDESPRMLVSPSFVRIERDDGPPDMQTQLPRFYARHEYPMLDPDGKMLASFKGMSGGPVVGIKRTDDGLRLWLVGIQSGEHKGHHMVTASLAEPFAQALAAEFEAL